MNNVKMNLKTPLPQGEGFTLIELLLVLTLLIIMLGFAVLTLRQHAENARINKASFEIEQVLQAAITYNTNNGKWPKDNSGGTCTPDPNSDFVQHYLPNAQAQSSFGYYYCWRAKGINKQLFSVALQVPDNDSNLAKRLAAHLPNAIITGDPNNDSSHDCETDQPCFVRTEISANTNTDLSAQIYIAGLGNCATGYEADQVPDRENCKLLPVQDQTEIFSITFPACPSNYDTKIIVTPNFITMPGMNQKISWKLQGYSFMRSKATANYNSCSISNGQETCQIDLQIQTCTNADCKALDILQTGEYAKTATIGASYMASCKMKNTSQTKKLF